MRQTLTLLVLATTMSCGGDDSSTTTTAPASVSSAEQQSLDLTDVIAESLDAIDEFGAISFTSAEAKCTADLVVRAIDGGRLIELGAASGEDLTQMVWSPDERDLVFAAVEQCVDLEDQLTELFVVDGADPEFAACVAELYAASDVLPEALFSTEPDADLDGRIDAALRSAVADCS